MKVIKEIALYEFDAWSGGRDTLKELSNEEMNELQFFIEQEFPEGLTEGELNDFLWFETDTIARHLGYESYENMVNTKNKQQ